MLEQMMKMLEGQQIGPYRLNKFLGAGGFGGVFHASERGDPRPPYQGGIKGGSAPPLSRGDQGGICAPLIKGGSRGDQRHNLSSI